MTLRELVKKRGKWDDQVIGDAIADIVAEQIALHDFFADEITKADENADDNGVDVDENADDAAANGDDADENADENADDAAENADDAAENADDADDADEKADENADDADENAADAVPNAVPIAVPTAFDVVPDLPALLDVNQTYVPPPPPPDDALPNAVDDVAPHPAVSPPGFLSSFSRQGTLPPPPPRLLATGRPRTPRPPPGPPPEALLHANML